jgi:hypothetical protein
MKLLDHKWLTWGFKAEADPGTNGRAIPYPRGRGARRLVFDQRAHLHPQPTGGLRLLGAA